MKSKSPPKSTVWQPIVVADIGDDVESDDVSAVCYGNHCISCFAACFCLHVAICNMLYDRISLDWYSLQCLCYILI